MGKRRKSRILAMKVLYVYELIGEDVNSILEDLVSVEDIKDNTITGYANNLIKKVIMNYDNLNNIIEDSTKNWTISRMAVIDRNILRIALTEIFFQDSVPDVVAIDEAIDIAKEYSTDDSGAFVNGILDYIVKNKKKIKIDK